MAGQSEEILNASDVLNWDYLVKIGAKLERPIKTLSDVLIDFAYNFTSAKSEDIRNQMLAAWLHDVTDNTSRENAEEVIKTLSVYLRTDHELLRKFAKQQGVRLKVSG